MVKKTVNKFKNEFKKSASTAIVAAFGFLIALSWKELIIEYVDKISAASPLQGKLFSTLIITALSVVGIMFISRVMTADENKKEPKNKENKK